MKKTIVKGYFALIALLAVALIIFLFFSFTKLEMFYSTSLEKIDFIKSSYIELSKFEESYFAEENVKKYSYIIQKYAYLEENLNELNKTLDNRELKFLLNEIREALLKHKESFFRSIVYFEDVKKGGDSDLYYIELFNLKKSNQLFIGQYNTFMKRTEKFIENLDEFYGQEKLYKEKLGFTIFFIIFFIMTLSLKYIFIWGENNGYNGIAKKNKGKKIKNLFN